VLRSSTTDGRNARRSGALAEKWAAVARGKGEFLCGELQSEWFAEEGEADLWDVILPSAGQTD